MLSKKPPELEDFKNYQPIHTAKNENTCSEEITKGRLSNHLIEKKKKNGCDSVDLFNQAFQQKPGIKMGL